jgi:hypothetical protein
MTKRWTVAVWILLAAGLAWADDPGIEDRVKDLERRLQESDARNADLARQVDQMRSQQQDLIEREVEDYLHETAGLEGGDAKGTESKAGAFFKIYGFLRFDTYYNTARASSVIVPFTVAPENGSAALPNDNQFAFDVRLTRVGFLFAFGQIGSSDLTGKLETDFSNFPAGVPESRETPRIRLAYIQIENAQWRLRLGQDWDVISPLYPSVNHEGVMWNAGNLGDRRPMAAFTWKAAEGFALTIAAGLTGAVNNQDLDPTPGPFTTTERDGFDVGWPHVQIRGAITRGSWVEGKTWTIGVWGYIAGLETDATFGGERHFNPWCGGIDLSIPLCRTIVLSGEVWFGQALGDIRGNVGQTINTATGEEIEGWGGWLEITYNHNERWTFYVGGTMDDPSNGDVPGGSPELNWTAYTGVRRNWSSRLRSVFDVIFWETQYAGAQGNMIRFNFWTSVDF